MKNKKKIFKKNLKSKSYQKINYLIMINLIQKEIIKSHGCWKSQFNNSKKILYNSSRNFY